MSEIKKWIGDKDRSLGRVLEDGRPKRDEARIDYAGPVPRVFNGRNEPVASPSKPINRGFWAALPGNSSGVLFGVVDSALGAINSDFKFCGGTYVVGPLKTKYRGGTLSPQGYHDVWSITRDGKAWLNGEPFPRREQQYQISGAKPLLFLRASYQSGQFAYDTKKFYTVTPFESVTRRYVGLVTVRRHTTGQSPSSVYDLADYRTDFYSHNPINPSGTAFADFAPGAEWRLSHVAGDAESIRLELWMKGAKAIYGADGPGNLIEPIGTRQMLFESRPTPYSGVEQLAYANTGAAFAGGYLSPDKTITPTDTVAQKDPLEDDLQLPTLAQIRRMTPGAEDVDPAASLADCQAINGSFVPLPGYRRTVHFTLAQTGEYKADELVSRYMAGTDNFNVDVSTLSKADYEPAKSTLSFLYLPLEITTSFSVSGKKGQYAAKPKHLQWSAPHVGSLYGGAQQSLAFGWNVPPRGVSNVSYGTGWFGDMDTNAYMVFTSSDPTYCGAHSVPLSGYSGEAIADSLKKVFSGVGYLYGYSSNISQRLESPTLGVLCDARVHVTRRESSLNGTKYTYNDMVVTVPETGSLVPFGQRTQQAFVNINCGYPEWLEDMVADQDREINIAKEEAAKRRYYYWCWQYGGFTQTSTAHNVGKYHGHATNYSFQTKEFIYLSPDVKIYFATQLVRKFGAGADYESRSPESPASTLTISIVTQYRGITLDEMTLYSGAVNDGLIGMAGHYYGQEPYDGGDAVNHPAGAVKDGIGCIFPPYSQQECCPFLAYTKESETEAVAQFYIDMPIRLVPPAVFGEPMGESETECLFIPAQFLNVLSWMTANYRAEDDSSAPAFQYLEALTQSLSKPIRLRMYYTNPTGTVKEVLPPGVQEKFGTSTVHFGRI